MKVFILIFFLCFGVNSSPTDYEEDYYEYEDPFPEATPCNSTVCKLPDCFCSGTKIPGGLPPEKTPQFVILTFDDAVTPVNMEYYRKIFKDFLNPDYCPVSGTFFVSHEYTDYSLVHELHANGHEISLHSITHEPRIDYWRDATFETLEREFADQRLLVSTFANISETDIKGIRMPFLQPAGDNQFEMLKSNNFLYDISLPTHHFIQPGLWPYTTEYKSIQECMIPPCFTRSFPNTWVVPMIVWKDQIGAVCSMTDACIHIPNTTEGLFEWMKNEFHRQYLGNRAPFGFYVHAAWFLPNEIRFQAYMMFINYLNTLDDVFIVSASQVIDWIKNPKPISEMVTNSVTCKKIYTSNCTPKSCKLQKENFVDRWFVHCGSSCPKSYPWLKNPLGERKIIKTKISKKIISE